MMTETSRKRRRKNDKIKVKEKQDSNSKVFHSLLSSYYPLVLPLREYLSLILPLSDSHFIFSSSTSISSEDAPYLQLAESLVAVDDAEAHSLKSLPDGKSLEKGKWSNWTPPTEDSPEADPSTIFQLVRLAQTVLMKQRIKTGRKNILIFGYKPSDDTGSSSVGSSISNVFPNTNVSRLTDSPQWARLLRSVGSSVFQHLITRCSIFTPLPGAVDCWNQLCGQPLSDSNLKPRMVKKLPKSASSLSSFPSNTTGTNFIETLAKRNLPLSSNVGEKQPSRQVSNSQPQSLKSRLGTLSRTKSMPVPGSDFNASKATAVRPLARVDSARSLLSDSSPITLRNSTAISPTNVSVVRSRVFYGKADRKSRLITAGYPSAHVFQSSLEQVVAAGLPSFLPLTDSRSIARRTLHTLKHIWPREYGLKHVWKEQPPTGVNKVTTPLSFINHNVREAELKSYSSLKTPKRLKEVIPLITLMLERHDRFDYRNALSLCCSSRIQKRGRLSEKDRLDLASKVEEEEIDARAAPSQPLVTQAVDESIVKPVSVKRSRALFQSIHKTVLKQAKEQPRFAQFRIPSGQVSRFTKMVINGIVPQDLLGSVHNFNLLKKRVGRFVVARRHETFNVHELMQSMRLCDFHWSISSNTRAQSQRSTPADHEKRKAMVSELLYWIFDSLLIPLLRTNFYVTEAAAYNYQVLYFRQDDWAKVTGPLQSKYTNGSTALFRAISNEQAKSMLDSRKLQYSTIRLLPKETGVRPIINLGRRVKKQIEDGWKGRGLNVKAKLEETPSVNQLLKPAFNILTFERKNNSDLLGSSVFGADDIFPRLKKYKETLQLDSKGQIPALYFVKVDVRKAFDTIVHSKLLEIIKDLMQHDSYIVHSHSRVMSHSEANKKNWIRKDEARPEFASSFEDLAAEMAQHLRHVVFVDSVVYSVEEREQAMATLEQHITGNLIKIGRKFFQQHTGIAQGSKVSALLCCYFYADLERKKLAFTNKRESLLMRYTDDFLFVTTSISDARRFFKVMCQGHPEYGCFVSPEKSLLNFNALTPDGKFVPRVQANEFLWAGLVINTRTLSVAQNLERYAFSNMGDSLTVRSGTKSGAAFLGKLKDEIRRRSHIIHTDRKLNSDSTTYGNVYQTFIVVALKFHSYLKALGVNPQIKAKFCEASIHNLIRYAYRHLSSRFQTPKNLSRKQKGPLRKDCVTWIGYHAFFSVLTPKRSHYGEVLRVLDSRINASGYSGARKKVGRMAKMVWERNAEFIKTVKY